MQKESRKRVSRFIIRCPDLCSGHSISNSFGTRKLLMSKWYYNFLCFDHPTAVSIQSKVWTVKNSAKPTFFLAIFAVEVFKRSIAAAEHSIVTNWESGEGASCASSITLVNALLVVHLVLSALVHLRNCHNVGDGNIQRNFQRNNKSFCNICRTRAWDDHRNHPNACPGCHKSGLDTCTQCFQIYTGQHIHQLFRRHILPIQLPGNHLGESVRPIVNSSWSV